MSEPRLSSTAVGLVSGSLFAVGLALSGMTDPGKVLGFLDVAGAWDPSLALVMAGAVGVHFTWLRWRSRRPARDEAPYSGPPQRVDAALLSGAAIFGVGWGMAGYCPGPALVAAAQGRSEALLFLVAMAGGAALSNAFRADVTQFSREPSGP
ncbi:MAG TPA: DUF6691 family protein [Polyangiaceae bacterium]|nr:DUF6691 family protein [Polyangiaceae bacterium]